MVGPRQDVRDAQTDVDGGGLPGVRRLLDVDCDLVLAVVEDDGRRVGPSVALLGCPTSTRA